ncbi:MAG: hypothetical protein GC190_20410 [Alphaproteobacteria bacterium]|nr:hypothetical protein [Alphaproteobacteria bacterium]
MSLAAALTFSYVTFIVGMSIGAAMQAHIEKKRRRRRRKPNALKVSYEKFARPTSSRAVR